MVVLAVLPQYAMSVEYPSLMRLLMKNTTNILVTGKHGYVLIVKIIMPATMKGGVMDCSCDVIMPTVYSETWRKACKSHVCCECESPIDPGEKYMDVTGLWDGEWYRFVVCEMCNLVRSEHSDEAQCIPFGEMWNYLGL